MSFVNSMSSFNEIDLALNEPPGFQPMLLPVSVLFGSLGLIVAAVKAGDPEGTDCAPPNCASETTSERTIQRIETGDGILYRRFRRSTVIRLLVVVDAPNELTQQLCRVFGEVGHDEIRARAANAHQPLSKAACSMEYSPETW
jgi:hypothetical protein